MPTYQYACTNPEGKHEFELVQSFTDAPVSECPECGDPVRKVYGSVGVVFKGSGFYRTDSRKAAAASASASASEKASSGSSSAKEGASSSKEGSSSSSKESSSSSSKDSSSSSTSSPAPAASTSSGSGSKAAN